MADRRERARLLITKENGDSFLRKGGDKSLTNEIRLTWLKKALFIFQSLRDKDKFADILSIMGGLMNAMGKSAEGMKLYELSRAYGAMDENTFVSKCDSNEFQKYVERPTHFDSQQGVLLLLDDLKSLAVMST